MNTSKFFQTKKIFNNNIKSFYKIMDNKTKKIKNLNPKLLKWRNRLHSLILRIIIMHNSKIIYMNRFKNLNKLMISFLNTS